MQTITTFQGKELKWEENIVSEHDYEFWRACDASGVNYLLCVFENPLDGPSEQADFLDTLTKVSIISHPCILPIIYFTACDPDTELPIIVFEYCSKQILKSNIHKLAATEKLMILSGIACACQTFEGQFLDIGPISTSHIFIDETTKMPKICNYGIMKILDNETSISAFAAVMMEIIATKRSLSSCCDDDEDDSSEDTQMPVMPSFFLDLYSNCEDVNSTVTFEDIVRKIMSEDFTLDDADTKRVHDYQFEVISPDIAKKMMIDIYQENDLQKSRFEELQSKMKFMVNQIRKLRKESEKNKERDLKSSIEGQRKLMMTLQEEIDALEYALLCSTHPHCRTVIPISPENSGIFKYLIDSQTSQFDKSVITSQSSGDVYCVIDPESTDNFSSGGCRYEWIEIAFPEPISVVSIKVKAAHRAFVRNWSITALSENDEEITIFEEDDSTRLDDVGKETIIDVDVISSRVFRLNKHGPNWEGKNFMRIKNIEFYSDNPRYLGGVLKTLVREAGGDPHKANVLVTSSNFGFSRWHKISPRTSLCTLFDTGNPWIQFELTGGRAIIEGYRLEMVSDYLFNHWSIYGSNGSEWTLIDDHRDDSQNPMKVVILHQELKPYKMFRIYRELSDEECDRKLRIRHFDIFGTYLSVSSQSVDVYQKINEY